MVLTLKTIIRIFLNSYVSGNEGILGLVPDLVFGTGEQIPNIAAVAPDQ